jgi:hypothetical protein
MPQWLAPVAVMPQWVFPVVVWLAGVVGVLVAAWFGLLAAYVWVAGRVNRDGGLDVDVSGDGD